jgi:hypothetical protein
MIEQLFSNKELLNLWHRAAEIIFVSCDACSSQDFCEQGCPSFSLWAQIEQSQSIALRGLMQRDSMMKHTLALKISVQNDPGDLHSNL